MTLDVAKNLISELRDPQVHHWSTLWRIERTDGTTLYFTDHQSSLEYQSNTYTPAGGFDASARQKQAGLKERNLQAVGVLDSAAITQDDLRAGRFREAKVTELLVDNRVPWAGPFVESVYWLVEVSWSGEQWEAEISGLTTWIRKRVGDVYSRNCKYDLGEGFDTIYVVGVDDTPTDNELLDKTTGFENATDADFSPFTYTAAEAIGDYCAWGMLRPFSRITFDNGSASAVQGVGGVVAWEYWNGTAWAALPNLVDATTSFTVAKADGQAVQWDVPISDWVTRSLDGSDQLYYVRARVTTVYTTNPVYDQGVFSEQDPADDGCKVNLRIMNLLGKSVDSVITQRLSVRVNIPTTNGVFDVTGAAADNADGWFNGGKVTWLTGNNAGLVSEIKTSIANASDCDLTFQLKTPFNIVATDTFDIQPGCDKTKTTCITKFNNIANHGGFPFVPGTDGMIRTPSAK